MDPESGAVPALASHLLSPPSSKGPGPEFAVPRATSHIREGAEASLRQEEKLPRPGSRA